MKYVKVKDDDSLIRDVTTNAIINTDSDGYLNYIQERSKKIKDMNKIENLENELSALKQSIEEIKDLLRSLGK